MGHGPGLAAEESVDLVGLWSRSFDKAQALAADLGVTAYEEYDALLSDVDAVAFAVPPDVQVPLATTAAERGRHLLLEKPVATDPGAARVLRDTAADSGASSVVFLTDRFSRRGQAWFRELHAAGGWEGGSVRWLASHQAPGNPFGQSAWRREKGALWDLGPHALSSLVAALGPVAEVVAVAGPGDLVHLVLTHEAGGTSSATLSLYAPLAALSCEIMVWGEAGINVMPDRAGTDAAGALGTAAAALRSSVASGVPHAADLRLGVRIVELLADAERQLGRS
jgi:predicted dehydrogenase